jgi:hypothetical protein
MFKFLVGRKGHNDNNVHPSVKNNLCMLITDYSVFKDILCTA